MGRNSDVARAAQGNCLAEFGLDGGIGYLFWFFREGKISDALRAIAWTGLFLCGVLIARQEKKIER